MAEKTGQQILDEAMANASDAQKAKVGGLIAEVLAEKAIGSLKSGAMALANVAKGQALSMANNLQNEALSKVGNIKNQILNSARLKGLDVLKKIPGLNKIAEITGLKGSLGTFGQLPFICSDAKVQTFTDMSIEHSERWATHEVIGQKPVLEHVGSGLKTLDFKMRFDAALGVNPEQCMNKLIRMMENGQYKTLIVGNEYLGQYVIESISETRKFHDGRGALLVAEATVKATEYANE